MLVESLALRFKRVMSSRQRPTGHCCSVKVAWAFSVGLLVTSPLLAQTVVYVDDGAAPDGDGLSWATAYDSLSTALDEAQPGDQVWVAAGTYVGNFTLPLEVEVYGGFAGTETELTQRDWTANPTILDGNQSGSVVTGPVGATETTRIDGFTITNGATGNGGGLYLGWWSSPTIANNTIAGNIAGYDGGGLYLYQSSPMIANNTITGNSARSGGGLRMRHSSYPIIVNNTIQGNSSRYGGGGLSLEYSSPTIMNNAIAGNRAGDYGGGMLLSRSSPTTAMNTITGNIAAFRGGGLYVGPDSNPTVANTIVAFNSSGIFVHEDGASASPRYNCVYGNTEYDYSGIWDPAGTHGNISTDPLFIRNPDHGGDGWGDDPDTPDLDEGANDDFGNLRLLPGSPSIDAGDNDRVPADTADLDEDEDTDEPTPFDLDVLPRIVNGSRGWSGVVDMGAYEYQPDCNDNGVSDALDIVSGVSRDRFPRASGGDGIPDECQTHSPAPR